MKWTTLDYIRKHSRIDFNCEDSLLELYASSAEDTILYLLQRNMNDLIDEFGEIPPSVRQATLEIVENSYTHRSPSSPQNLSLVPYSIDFLLKPLMKL